MSHSTRKHPKHSKGHSKATRRGSDFERNEAQNERPKPKEHNNNNKIINNITPEVKSQESIRDSAPSIYSLSETSSAQDQSQSETENKSISLKESGEDSEQKLRVPFERSPSALRVLIQKYLFNLKTAGFKTESKTLAETMAYRIKRQHVEWSESDVLTLFSKLSENDEEIQGLLAEVRL